MLKSTFPVPLKMIMEAALLDDALISRMAGWRLEVNSTWLLQNLCDQSGLVVELRSTALGVEK
jgi:hypothetical protein